LLNRPKRKSWSLERKNALSGYLFTMNWLIGFLAFSAFPLLFSLFMSTQHVNISSTGIDTRPLGIEHYVYAFTMDISFLEALIGSLQKVVVLTPLILVLSLILSMLIKEKIFARGLFRAIYFLPVIILSGFLMQMLDTNGAFDVINLNDSSVLRFLQKENLGVLYSIISFLLNNIFDVMWFSGVQILVYLTGLNKISPDSYEAASIDGASKWQVFWKLTLPSLSQFTLINLVYTIVLISTFPTTPLMAHIRDNMFGPANHRGLGYSAALSWIYLIVIVIVLLLFYLVIRSRDRDSVKTKRGVRR
jgi:oligogalacturonide transport system permease protein